MAAFGVLIWYVWSIVPATLCVVLALAIREPAVVPHAARPAFDWRYANLPPDLKRFLWVVALFTLGNSSNMFLLLRAQELGLPQADILFDLGCTEMQGYFFGRPVAPEKIG